MTDMTPAGNETSAVPSTPAPQTVPSTRDLNPGTVPTPLRFPSIPFQAATAFTGDRLLVVAAAALLVGVLIGGAPGIRPMALHMGAETSAAAVINNVDSVTSITAAIAKAAPSIVTVTTSGTQSSGSGSGVIISADGYILTNNHVVTSAEAAGDVTVKVKLSDGRLFTGTVIGTDPMADLAVIKLDDATGLTPIIWADSTDLNVGDTTIALGSPLGLPNSSSTGIISALNRSITVAATTAASSVPTPAPTVEPELEFELGTPGWGNAPTAASEETTVLPVIQTDAAINHGNSGGALVNGAGDLIGINVAIANGADSTSPTAGSIGVGFAIPSSLAQRVSAELIKSGTATHGLIGASVSNNEAEENSVVAGALVREVTADGPSDEAGLLADDVIVKFNGLPITSSADITAQVRAVAAGSTGELVVIRGRENVTLTVIVGTLTN